MRTTPGGILLLFVLLILLPKTLCAKAAGNMLEQYLGDPRLAATHEVLGLVEITPVQIDSVPRGRWDKTGTLTLQTLETVGGPLPRTLLVPFEQRTGYRVYQDEWTWDFVELARGRRLLGFFNHWNGSWVVTADGATGVISNVENIRPATLRRVQTQFRTPLLLHRYAPSDPYAGRYQGTFTPNNAGVVPATGTVTATGNGNYEIVLHARPTKINGNGSQWRDYDLPGGIVNGQFHMAFVSGQIVEPVTFSPGRFTAIVQGKADGGTFKMRRSAP